MLGAIVFGAIVFGAIVFGAIVLGAALRGFGATPPGCELAPVSVDLLSSFKLSS